MQDIAFSHTITRNTALESAILPEPERGMTTSHTKQSFCIELGFAVLRHGTPSSSTENAPFLRRAP